MALTPHDITGAQFDTVKRNGYDKAQVDEFKRAAAEALETARQQSTAMEARARAAVARLQEMSQPTADAPAAPTVAPESVASPSVGGESAPALGVSEAETISRTLLLAQRTADTTIAEAEREAQAARREAAAAGAAVVEAAKVESRKAGEAERVRVEGEVQALLARRDFLESDVTHLEQHIEAQRGRITDVVSELQQLATRVPNGLGEARRPQLSASDHPSAPTDQVVASEDDDEDDDVDVATLIDQVAADDAAAANDTVGPAPDRAPKEPDDADADAGAPAEGAPGVHGDQRR